MKTRVFDSWSILEWIRGRQPAGGFVQKLLLDGESGLATLFMSAINVGEVFYFLRKEHSESLSESWRQSSQSLPMTVEVPSAEDIWNAAILKSRYPIAYADAFAAALAQKWNCPLVTGDPEFRSVKFLELDWIGK
jgi:ribonuclease VapC